MSVINIALEIPDWIEQGLNDGSLFRNAAGIIRNLKCQIVAHLREVVQNSIDNINIPKIQYVNVNNNLSAIIGVFNLLNIGIGFIILNEIHSIRKEIKSINLKLDTIIENQKKQFQILSEIKNLELQNITLPYYQARQFFMNDQFDKVTEYCNISAGSIFHYIYENSFEFHMHNLDTIYKALLVLSCTIYMHSISQLNINKNQVSQIIQNYRLELTQLKSKLKTDYSNFKDLLHSKIPDIEELEILKNINNVKDLNLLIKESIEQCRSESLALEAECSMSENQKMQAYENGYYVILPQLESAL